MNAQSEVFNLQTVYTAKYCNLSTPKISLMSDIALKILVLSEFEFNFKK